MMWVYTVAMATVFGATLAFVQSNEDQPKPATETKLSTERQSVATKSEKQQKPTIDAKVPALNGATVRSIAQSNMTEEQKLAAFHRVQSQNPHVFSWELHNELRHLYSGRDERASMGHCDIILSRSADDHYILSILSNWTLGKDNLAAAAALEAKATRYSDLRHLVAACLLKARSLRQDTKIGDVANR